MVLIIASVLKRPTMICSFWKRDIRCIFLWLYVMAPWEEILATKISCYISLSTSPSLHLMSRILCYYQRSTLASQIELAMHDLSFFLFFPCNVPFGYDYFFFLFVCLAFFTLPPLCDVHFLCSWSWFLTFVPICLMTSVNLERIDNR